MASIIEGEWSYFLKNPACLADNPFQSGCSCWARQGTGPHFWANPEETNELTWRHEGTRQVIWAATE